MTSGDATWVTDPRGHVHTGSGNQLNNNWYVSTAADRLIRTGADPLQVVREHRAQLSRRFVRPRDFGRAAERLTEPGAAVLLDGPPGSGRRAAATMLLHELSGTEGRFEELSAEPEEGSLDAAPDDRFLLDLSSMPADDYPAAQKVLATYRSAVDKGGARLVVVLPTGLDYLLEPEYVPLVVQLGRPRGHAVLSRYLRVDGVDFAPEHLTDPALGELLRTSPMRELARLAEMIRRARDSGRYGQDFPAWCDEALAAVTNWTKQVARQVSAHRTPDERALLLTAAMFSGASADAVFHGCARLLKRLGHTEDERPRLAQADLAEQLESLKIRRDHEDRICFEHLAYDGALRKHFWANFPDLRDALRDWIGQSVRLRDLSADDRMNLVARFAEQCLAAGRPDHLWTLAERWTQPTHAKRLHAEAAAALEHGLNHERYGARVRAQIYDWATGPHLSVDLAQVLTGVCQQVLAATHPDQALVRLHHLALRGGEQKTSPARTALLALARRDRRLYLRLVDRLLFRLPARAESNLALLIELLGPAGQPKDVRGPELSRAWATVLTERPATDWAPTVRDWLSAVHADERRAPVLDLLPTAAGGRADVLNRLYVITCEWARGDAPAPTRDHAARAATAARFWRTIDRAQGADMTDGGPDAPDLGETQ